MFTTKMNQVRDEEEEEKKRWKKANWKTENSLDFIMMMHLLVHAYNFMNKNYEL